jgi:hypothetical protein
MDMATKKSNRVRAAKAWATRRRNAADLARAEQGDRLKDIIVERVIDKPELARVADGGGAGIATSWKVATAAGYTSEFANEVDHPEHYNKHPSGVECIDIVEHMMFNPGNSVKYQWRAGFKKGAPAILDAEKAAWYAQREVIRLRKLKTQADIDSLKTKL